ncbi:MAG: hypothetical protein EAZ97_08145 [Bacteroidetes bacterium]|nr:MAG: hypothetical protein EAZ97_08145 [Bacteroidota bacterium]
MKLADIKAQIDAYFERVDPMEVVKRFEELGYIFEDIDESEDDYLYYFVEVKPLPQISTHSNSALVLLDRDHYNLDKVCETSINTISSNYEQNYEENIIFNLAIAA